MAWSYNDANMAMDILDWRRLWGSKPVGFDEWKGRLHPDARLNSAQRTWLRLRQRLLKSRYQPFIEVSKNPDSFHGELELAILPGAEWMANKLLDVAETRRKRRLLKKGVRRMDAARRREAKRREAARQTSAEAEPVTA